MADAFTGEIRVFGFNYPPVDWAFCDGSSVPVNQNQALYAVIGNTYGGNTTTFQLPDLRGRAPMGFGNGPGLTPRPLGSSPGETEVALAAPQMGPHNHPMNAYIAANNSDLTAAPAVSARMSADFRETPTPLTPLLAYSNIATPNTVLSASSLGAAGQGSAHPNAQPYQVFSFCICMNGVWPARG